MTSLVAEGPPDSEVHRRTSDVRKRLGQVFTGDRLSRLLAALAGVTDTDAVVDPMAGTGDLLAACRELAPRAQLGGIDVDGSALAYCERRLRGEVITAAGSAFDSATWAGLPTAYDLVITNPPYVRYQTGRESRATSDLTIPGASDIRRALLAQIATLDHLTGPEREAFLRCAADYSGLSDLAVPSWLLCAARVAPGGKLAMVVPDTWLSRNYAAPVLYVLRRFFDIRYVVEDHDAAWFSDALVRTNLVVARRTVDKNDAFTAGKHLRISLRGEAAGNRSLVARALPGTTAPERAFASWAEGLREDKDLPPLPGVVVHRSDEGDLLAALRAAARRLPWVQLAPFGTESSPTELPGSAPEKVRRALGAALLDTVTLADHGWRAGQGLRTGANDFFYVTRGPDGDWHSPLLPGERLDLPSAAVRPAVRNQQELPLAGRVAEGSTGLLVLDGFALPEDVERAAPGSTFTAAEGDLARLLRVAAAHIYQRSDRRVALPDLSAVSPNVRLERVSQAPTRFWYHLPDLAPRHVPRLFMPRVCHGRPLPYVNPGGTGVVDANFSTFYPSRPTALDEHATLALLSSTWVWCCLEASSTVLGGGALKVEATGLKRLPLPILDAAAVSALSELGRRLRHVTADADTVLAAIDAVLAGALMLPASALSRLEALAQQLVNRRGGGRSTRSVQPSDG
ncbi:methyltransferase [Modestobacter sp. URMC 112]